MDVAKVPWSEGLIALCRKCGEKLQNAEGLNQNPCAVAKDAAKKRLQERGRWKKVRVVLVDCLDVCPQGEVTVLQLRPNADASGGTDVKIQTVRPMELDPIEDRLRQ